MMLFSTAKNTTEGNGQLEEQLGLLYESYLVHGMVLSPEWIDQNLDLSIATTHSLVKNDAAEKRWLIEPNCSFAYYVLRAKLPDLEGDIPDSLVKLNGLFERATERSDDQFSPGTMQLDDRLLELLLALIHEQSGQDFSAWIPQLADESTHRLKFEFLQAYCAIADELPLSGRQIAEACQHFLSWQDLAVSHSVSPLLLRFAANNQDEAETLICELPDDYTGVKSGLLAGLLEHYPERSWQFVQAQFVRLPNQAFILNAIHILLIPNPLIGHQVLDLLFSWDQSILVNRRSMPYALTRLVDRVTFTDDDFEQRCYSKLTELAQVEELQTAQAVLQALRFSVEKQPALSVRVLLALLDNSVITHEHVGKLNYHPSFDGVLQDVEDVDLQFHFFEAYARRYAMHFRHDTFYSTIYQTYMHPSMNMAFRKKVFDCLVHDEGAVRIFGNALLDFFDHYHHAFEFHQDITQLHSINQYKLWMSVLLLYKQPKDTLPRLLPLLKSDEPIVAEAFLCKLEELSECYHKGVLDLVENFAQQEDPVDERIATALSRLKAHYDAFCRQLDEKTVIAEFHPGVSQTALYDRFNELHRYKMNERISEFMDNQDGLINLFKKVVLAKGGGWKHAKREGISKLGRFQSSYSWPRLHLLNPEKFDLYHRLDRAEDWTSDKTDFIEWITESSSGSI